MSINSNIVVTTLNNGLANLENIISGEDVSEDAVMLAQGVAGHFLMCIDVVSKQATEISDLNDLVINLKNDIQNLIGQIENRVD